MGDVIYVLNSKEIQKKGMEGSTMIVDIFLIRGENESKGSKK